jgi:hypothetical protein
MLGLELALFTRFGFGLGFSTAFGTQTCIFLLTHSNIDEKKEQVGQ